MWCMQYIVVLDRILTALDWIIFITVLCFYFLFRFVFYYNGFLFISIFIMWSTPVTDYRSVVMNMESINTVRPRQDGRHFADDIFICIFFNEYVWILLMISRRFVPKVHINNIPAQVQIMAWCRQGNKPLFEPMMVSLPTHICVTWPQGVNLPMAPIAIFNYLYVHYMLLTLYTLYYHRLLKWWWRSVYLNSM